MSSWQISSWLQGASGNQFTLPNVFTKHTSSNKNQVIHSDPTSGNKISNQPTTHILHILYSSRSSFWGRHGVFLWLCVFRWTVWEGETKCKQLSTRGVSEREKHQQMLSTYLSNITCILFLIIGIPVFEHVDLVDASERFGWCVQLYFCFNHQGYNESQ